MNWPPLTPTCPRPCAATFAFAEDRLNAPPSAGRDLWFKRFVDGDIVGCAWTEIGNVAIGDVVTQVSPDGDTWKLNGEKFYSTGSIFSDWIDVYAQRSDTGGDVIAATRTRQPGVVQSDDWDGFGQRTTGSGTTRFTDAVVDAENLIDFATRFKYQTAFLPVSAAGDPGRHWPRRAQRRGASGAPIANAFTAMAMPPTSARMRRFNRSSVRWPPACTPLKPAR